MAKKILIVDDEQNLVELLKFRLEANGYIVEAAFDGEEGLKAIREKRPDLVILDVMMPKMHGYDVCRASKKNARTRSIPIILLTARAQKKDVDEAAACGADAWIAKPFEPKELLSQIEKFLK
jgi:DNA-binding response OmpR family regulator